MKSVSVRFPQIDMTLRRIGVCFFLQGALTKPAKNTDLNMICFVLHNVNKKQTFLK